MKIYIYWQAMRHPHLDLFFYLTTENKINEYGKYLTKILHHQYIANNCLAEEK